MIEGKHKNYTWVDIQDRIFGEKRRVPKGVRMEIYRSGLYVYFNSTIDQENATRFLKDVFPTAFNTNSIQLESEESTHKYLPIIWEETEEELGGAEFVPTLSRSSILVPPPEPSENKRMNGDPYMMAFHSFKGGVGRTLHAIVMAFALEDSNQKVLLIDGDFEAPGISWAVTEPEISFADFINLAHSSADPFEEIPFIARELKNQKQNNIFLFPAFRSLDQMRSLEIKPEHVFRFSDEPFILTDLVEALGKELGVSHIIIDLRAGISELSSSWLLDPRIANVFVTTLGSQSIQGTKVMLELLAGKQKEFGLVEGELPSLIISRVDPTMLKEVEDAWNNPEQAGDFIQSRNTAELRNLYDSYLHTLFPAEEGPRGGDVNLGISQVYSELLVLPNDWSAIGKQIGVTGIKDNLRSILANAIQREPEEGSVPFDGDLEESRKELAKIAPQLVHAEGQDEVVDFYRSRAIKNLVNRNQTRLPNLVIIGAKGAGKTFLFRQLIKSQTWQNFCERVEKKETNEVVKARIIPVTLPKNLPDNEKPPVWTTHVSRMIKEGKSEKWDELKWQDRWLDMLAWSDDFKVGEKGVFEAYLKNERDGKILFVFDGLEESFSNFFDEGRHEETDALRTLFYDVRDYLAAIPNSPFGVIVFIRGDIVDHVLKQNPGQFKSRFDQYALKWDRTEALRLVLWVLVNFEIFPVRGVSIETLHQLEYDQLVEKLYFLWGRKLGSAKSKEALSARRVLDSLSNFNHEIQSRDLMNFLLAAIKNERASTAEGYSDRILRPASVREAIPEVGAKKVEEIKEESRGTEFESALAQLESIASQIQVPAKEIIGLDSKQLKVLIDNGVLKLYKNKYYMAEIYRTGLSIKQTPGKAKTSFDS